MTDQTPTVVRTPAERIDEFFRNQRDGRALAEFADALAEVSKGDGVTERALDAVRERLAGTFPRTYLGTGA